MAELAVLVLTHGRLADELLIAVRAIVPGLDERVQALALPWDVAPDDAHRRVEERLSDLLDEALAVLVLTDMFGGTATNLALPFLEAGRLEVVTGVNLPMMVKLGAVLERETDLSDAAHQLAEGGAKSIRVASEFLRGRRGSGGGAG